MTNMDAALDSAIEQAEPNVRTETVCTRPDLIDRMRQLNAELAHARVTDEQTNEPDKAPGIARELLEVEAQVQASQVEFRLLSIGAVAWSDLIGKHPPKPKQREQYPGIDYNPDTFPFIAVAASMGCDPADDKALAETAGKLRKLAARVSQGQWAKVWKACLEVNVGDVTVPFTGHASALLHGVEQNSTPATTTGSPEATG